jgi:hypothetical protein
MKFEFLPNELLISCFDYLNAPDIFYSFDQLNCRFNKLIRNIPLNLNFQDIQKSTFDRFCIKMLLNPEIKKQIHSLQLSDDGTCRQTESFLSFFSFVEFPSLRSLTLIKVEKNEVYLKSLDTHPTLPGVLTRRFPGILESSSLTNLTIGGCTCLDLSQLFKYAPMLKCLEARFMGPCPYTRHYKDFSNHCDYKDFNNHCATHLKKLILIEFYENFENFEMLIKQTPNLQSLTLKSNYVTSIIDAHRWENLITTFIPQLTIFKFEFSCFCSDRENVKEFQTDFWHKQHHWFTEYSLTEHHTEIYTIPRVLHTTHAIYLGDKLNTFNAVKTLTVYYKAVIKPCQQYFPNVTTLDLQDLFFYSSRNNGEDVSIEEYFQSLKMIINLSNLKHLKIHKAYEKNISFLLLRILQEAPKLSLLTIDSKSIILLFNNDELCKYLNTMIKKLHMDDDGKFFSNNDIKEKFCNVFSNLEQFICRINDPYCLLVLLERLSNLSLLESFMAAHIIPFELLLVEDELRKLNVLFCIESTDVGDEEYPDVYYKLAITINIWSNNYKQ